MDILADRPSRALGSWQAKKWTERLVLLALGIVVTVIGWSLISHPLVGIIRLTYVVAILFVASGFAKVVAAFWYRIPPFFWVLLLSGLVSVLIGALTLANFPQSAAVMLGLLLSVELFSNGLAMIALAIILKRAA